MKEYYPMLDRVLLRPLKQKQHLETKGGLIDVSKKPTQQAIVYAVGAGWTAKETGLFVPNILHKGDIVLTGEGAGLPMDIELEDGTIEEMKLLREDDVLMMVKEKESKN